MKVSRLVAALARRLSRQHRASATTDDRADNWGRQPLQRGDLDPSPSPDHEIVVAELTTDGREPVDTTPDPGRDPGHHEPADEQYCDVYRRNGGWLFEAPDTDDAWVWAAEPVEVRQ